jgi:hypothetical protein
VSTGSALNAGRVLAVSAVLLAALTLPAAAQAEIRTFLNTTLTNTQGTGDAGPATPYPSSIVISGFSGTVRDANVTLIGLDSARPDDIDLVITGPNGQKVFLISDACGTTGVSQANWSFDDSAPIFPPDAGPCFGGPASFKPSNHAGAMAEPDNLGVAGGPAPPYSFFLSLFNGASPNGTWSLYLFDDEDDLIGGNLPGWALTLDILPPDVLPPDASFTIGDLKGKTLSVNVNSPGAVEIIDGGSSSTRRLKTSSATGGPGTIEVPLKLTSAGKRKLREKGKVRVNARITFTPSGGTASSQTAKLKIKKKKKKK